MGNGDVTVTRPVRLPHGWCSAVMRFGVVERVAWERTREELLESAARTGEEFTIVDPAREAVGRILLAYAAGEVVRSSRISALPIAWNRVGPFDRAALEVVASIPYGSTATYGEVAALAGMPGRARAVGGAMSRNFWPVIIPCHRVIGAGGKMVGFGKGISAKEALLSFERKNAAA